MKRRSLIAGLSATAALAALPAGYALNRGNVTVFDFATTIDPRSNRDGALLTLRLSPNADELRERLEAFKAYAKPGDEFILRVNGAQISKITATE